ncbi:MAG TPA: signal peptidase I [Gammaproteobacteria bacterium]|nr:signal peptidase I [Gammaproteobacteria bacterium]
MSEPDSKTSAEPAAVSKAQSSRAKWWISELISLAIVLAAVTAARSSLADHYFVPSGSMEYSLMPGDRVIVNKMSYGVRIPLTKIDIFGSSTPERGEIAVFDSPQDGTTRLIKRIVAIGGDRVSVVDGQLSINGQALGDRMVEHFGKRDALLNLTSQPFVNHGGGPNFEKVVPPGMVLAMGDNRGNSNDGRAFGFIDERELFGRAVAVYYRSSNCTWYDLPCVFSGFTWKPL